MDKLKLILNYLFMILVSFWPMDLISRKHKLFLLKAEQKELKERIQEWARIQTYEVTPREFEEVVVQHPNLCGNFSC